MVLLDRALKDREHGLGGLNVEIAESLLQQIAVFAGGDARIAFNVLETVVQGTEPEKGPEGKKDSDHAIRFGGRSTAQRPSSMTRRARSISI